ncbi:polymer-forming cytoskeletal protein [Sporolactobacillus spathodeae]|uniref:Type 4 fimbrial biogenesis protein PilX N-terminal domain-containing protein n=1 Tax=Sporolactobacillus spathodeae TaxID=1465502 RepID=A0ABS2Q8V8_9BACL|nr:polymer-forming cytoskeletal protein [Sporolactobacillus spathodeae]MBM7657402.1 hypothetical protein [Sporolactobacillus spathodeae]
MMKLVKQICQSNESGYALLIVMLVISFLMIASLSLMGVSYSHSQQITHEQYRVQATDVAEMGMKNFSTNLNTQLMNLSNDLNSGKTTIDTNDSNDPTNSMTIEGQITNKIESIAQSINANTSLSALQNHPSNNLTVQAVDPATITGLTEPGNVPFKITSSGVVNGVNRQVSQMIVISYTKKVNTTTGDSDGTGINVPNDFNGSLTMGNSQNRYLLQYVDNPPPSSSEVSISQSSEPEDTPPNVSGDATPAAPDYSSKLEGLVDQWNSFFTKLMNNNLLRADNIYLDNQTTRCYKPVINANLDNLMTTKILPQFSAHQLQLPSSANNFTLIQSGAINGSQKVSKDLANNASYNQDVNFAQGVQVNQNSGFNDNVSVKGMTQFTKGVSSEVRGNLTVKGDLLVGSNATVTFNGDVNVSGSVVILPGAKVTFGSDSTNTLWVGKSFWTTDGSEVTVNSNSEITNDFISRPSSQTTFKGNVNAGRNFFIYPWSNTEFLGDCWINGDEYGWFGGSVKFAKNVYFGGSIYRSFLFSGSDSYNGYVYINGSLNDTDFLSALNSSTFERTVFVRKNAYVNEMNGALNFTHGLVVAGNANLNGGERLVWGNLSATLLNGTININPIHQGDNTSTSPVTTTTYNVSLNATFSSPDYTYATAPDSK